VGRRKRRPRNEPLSNRPRAPATTVPPKRDRASREPAAAVVVVAAVVAEAEVVEAVKIRTRVRSEPKVAADVRAGDAERARTRALEHNPPRVVRRARGKK